MGGCSAWSVRSHQQGIAVGQNPVYFQGTPLSGSCGWELTTVLPCERFVNKSLLKILTVQAKQNIPSRG